MAKRKATTTPKRIKKKARVTKTLVNKTSKKKGLTKVEKKQVRAIAERTHHKGVPTSVIQRNFVGHHSSVVTAANTVDLFNNVQRTAGNTTPYTSVAMGITPFNGNRLLDAASCAYNGKTLAINYENTTNNFAFTGLKVNINHASYMMKLKNSTEMVYEMTLYRFKNKVNSNTDVYTDYSNAIASELWVGGAPSVTTINLTPGMLSAMHEKYTWRTEKFHLPPGAEKKWYLTWKGCLDGEKLSDGAASPAITAYHRAYGEQWMFCVKPALALTSSGPTVGRITPAASTSNELLFEFKETYVIEQPPNTAEANEGPKRKFLNDYEANAAGTLMNRYLIGPNYVQNNGGA